MESVTLKCLLAGSKARLGITSQAGLAGLDRGVSSVQSGGERIDEVFPGPFSRASILVIAPTAGVALANAAWGRQSQLFAALPAAGITGLALAGIFNLPDSLARLAEQTATLVFSSRFDDHLLISRLTGLLAEKLYRRIQVQGSLVNICGSGVLITGVSGAGKTTLALAMAGRGHKWIADDAVEIEKYDDETLHGRSQTLVKNLLEIKGRGVIPVEDLLDAASVDEATAVDMVVEIGTRRSAHARSWKLYRKVMGVRLPLFQIPLSCCPDRYEQLENAARTIAKGSDS